MGGGGGVPYPISLEVNREVSHIPLSKLEIIPLIKFPKYPISLEVNKNIIEIINTKYEYRNIWSSDYFMLCFVFYNFAQTNLFHRLYFSIYKTDVKH